MNDDAIRRALARIEQSYVEPGRIDPRGMLEGALQSVAGAPAPADGDCRVSSAGLVERLAATLERSLDSGFPGSRDRRRAMLLTGALRTLDPYSRAVSGSARLRLLDRYRGTTCGIGVRIGRRDGAIRVLRCFPGGAASGAGIRPGDELAAVDGRSLEGRRVVEALRALRGSRGTRVTVSLDRKPRVDLLLTRRPFARTNLEAAVGADLVARLRIRRLSRNTPREFDRWIASIRAPSRVRGLLLDLRGNGGGSMLAAAAIADRFVARGRLVEALDRNGRPVPGLTSAVDAGKGVRPAWPLAVLLDRSTSSAAELLAAALAWNDRALLFGQRSFGKTTVLKLYHDPQDDLTLRLAVAYMRAAGRPLPAEGLEPDVVADPDIPGETEAAALRSIREHGSVSREVWLARVSSD